jgi:hypothetical protein
MLDSAAGNVFSAEKGKFSNIVLDMSLYLQSEINICFMLENLFKWYIDNQNELVKQFSGKFLVIRDNAVAGAYDSDAEALLDAEKKYGLGTFIIQECTPGEDAYTQHFSSRVIFS